MYHYNPPIVYDLFYQFVLQSNYHLSEIVVYDDIKWNDIVLILKANLDERSIEQLHKLRLVFQWIFLYAGEKAKKNITMK